MDTMELAVLDSNFDIVGFLDNFESLIWTDRYSKCGDFEIYTGAGGDILSLAKKDYYLWNKNSDRLMIIEKQEIDTDYESGNKIKITGRSLESILDRRIVWGQKDVTGSLQDKLKEILTENIISPSIASRKISNFIFEASTDTKITSLTIDKQYKGDNLYTLVQGLCEDNNLGFKITLNSSHQFVFKLYFGVDHSYKQTALPYIVFSPSYDNLSGSNYIDSNEKYKNVNLVEQEYTPKTDGSTTSNSINEQVVIGTSEGLSRREMYTSGNAQQTLDDKTELTEAQFISKMKDQGNTEINKVSTTTTFEGDIVNEGQYVYGKDFQIGDIVEIRNEYNVEGRVRITEVVRADKESGTSIVPTLEAIGLNDKFDQ